jgi:aspartate/methionine/tyrosine aminotransferase
MKPTPLAARMRDIQPFHVMDLLARARALEASGRSIVHMEIGEPDFATAAPIVAAGRRALERGHTHYTLALGLPALREALSEHYRKRFGAAVSAERICVTPGASGALQLALGVLIDPGDEVLMADPGYPCNRHFVRLYDGRAVGIPVGPEEKYQLTARRVEVHWSPRTAAVLLASPSNPTGTLIDPEELAAIAELVRRRGGRLIVDEIYQGLVYQARPSSAAVLSPEVFIVNSFSKYFGMTGWRVGWLVVPPEYLDAVDRLAQNLFIAASTPAQYAALAALGPEAGEILEQRREAYRERRDFLLPALRRLGFEVPVAPQGAFYLYADCSRFGIDSERLAAELLEREGVCVTPGKDFGSHAPERHLRFAYTTSLAQLAEGVRRMERFFSALPAT